MHHCSLKFKKRKREKTQIVQSERLCACVPLAKVPCGSKTNHHEYYAHIMITPHTSTTVESFTKFCPHKGYILIAIG